MPEESCRYVYDVDLSMDCAGTFVAQLAGREKRVLELGCGPGSVTRVLAEHGGCRVTGLERDQASLELAACHCEATILADLDADDWPAHLGDAPRFDVVVAADVLEHLRDPWTALRRAGDLLGPGGYVVVSLPHSGHAAFLACLLGGDFAYQEYGLLDHTHIRFFCLKNIEELFARASLKIVEARFVSQKPEETELAEYWARTSDPVKKMLCALPHADVYQVVVKAAPLDFPAGAVSLSRPSS